MSIEILVLFLIGTLFGYIGGYAGIGGAPFLIAILVLFFGFSQLEAQGTILAVMLGPMSLLGLMSMRKQVIELKYLILIGFLSYALFSYVGAIFAFAVDENEVKFLFGILLFGIGALDLIINNSKSINSKTPKKQLFKTNLLNISIVGILVGIMGGFFGIGAGVLMVPIFINFFNFTKDQARTLSLAILVPPVSLGAVLKYNDANSINWHYAIIIFAAYFLTNYFGAEKAKEHSPKYLKVFQRAINITGFNLFNIKLNCIGVAN